VTGKRGNRFFVSVCSMVNGEEVLAGEFVIFAKGSEED
jgi:hypothetical protein